MPKRHAITLPLNALLIYSGPTKSEKAKIELLLNAHITALADDRLRPKLRLSLAGPRTEDEMSCTPEVCFR